MKEAALSDPKMEEWIGDREIRKVIYVPKRLMNLVIG